MFFLSSFLWVHILLSFPGVGPGRGNPPLPSLYRLVSHRGRALAMSLGRVLRRFSQQPRAAPSRSFLGLQFPLPGTIAVSRARTLSLPLASLGRTARAASAGPALIGQVHLTSAPTSGAPGGAPASGRWNLLRLRLLSEDRELRRFSGRAERCRLKGRTVWGGKMPQLPPSRPFHPSFQQSSPWLGACLRYRDFITRCGLLGRAFGILNYSVSFSVEASRSHRLPPTGLRLRFF